MEFEQYWEEVIDPKDAEWNRLEVLPSFAK